MLISCCVVRTHVACVLPAVCLQGGTLDMFVLSCGWFVPGLRPLCVGWSRNVRAWDAGMSDCLTGSDCEGSIKCIFVGIRRTRPANAWRTQDIYVSRESNTTRPFVQEFSTPGFDSVGHQLGSEVRQQAVPRWLWRVCCRVPIQKHVSVSDKPAASFFKVWE